MTKPITDADRIDKVHVRTLPTVAFTLRLPQVDWIAAEAKRRGISKSELVRELIDLGMTGADVPETTGKVA